MRRDADELDGFLDFLAGEISHDGPRGRGRRGFSATTASAPRFARCPPPERTVTTATPAGCSSTPSGWRRSAARRPSSIRACAATSSLAAALLHDVGRTLELGRGPAFRPTEEGRLLGHVHLGLRLIEERSAALDAAARAELLHAVAVHHDRQAAHTAEAAVLYHANQLDAQAATRPVGRGLIPMTAVVLALVRGGAVGDGRLPRRPLAPGRLNVLIVLFWSQLVGLLGVAVWIGVERRGAPGCRAAAGP